MSARNPELSSKKQSSSRSRCNDDLYAGKRSQNWSGSTGSPRVTLSRYSAWASWSTADLSKCPDDFDKECAEPICSGAASAGSRTWGESVAFIRLRRQFLENSIDRFFMQAEL